MQRRGKLLYDRRKTGPVNAIKKVKSFYIYKRNNNWTLRLTRHYMKEKFVIKKEKKTLNIKNGRN